MTISENNKAIAYRWIASFNEKKLEDLLSLYAEDAVHFSPKLKLKEPATGGWIKGKAALQAWWQAAFTNIPSLEYLLKNIIVNDDQLLMEYLRIADGEPEMMVAEILEISNGLITASRVYHA